MKNRIEDTNFYKFLKEKIEMIVECCNEETYSTELTEADKDSIAKELINNEEFTETIHDFITESIKDKMWEKYEEEE